jgi:hypothetical protein
MAKDDLEMNGNQRIGGAVSVWSVFKEAWRAARPPEHQVQIDYELVRHKAR